MNQQLPLGFGVVGLGVGKQHVYAIAVNNDCSLKAVHDLDASLATHTAAELSGVRVANRFQDILDDPEIDAVVIASYDQDHFGQVVAALEAKKHVFVEKPLCRSLEELSAIKELLSETKGQLVLWSNLILRAAPLYRWLRKEIMSGALGSLYAFDGDYLYGRLEKITTGWRSAVDDYSVIAGGGVHLVDLVLWMTGERPITVTAVSNGISTEGTAFRPDDFMAATLEFPSGMIARVTANFGCVHRHQHAIRVFGTKATFLNDDKGARLHISRDPNTEVQEITLAALAGHKGDLITEFVADIAARKTDGSDTTQQMFLDAISVCVAIDRAGRSRRPEEVTYV